MNKSYNLKDNHCKIIKYKIYQNNNFKKLIFVIVQKKIKIPKNKKTIFVIIKYKFNINFIRIKKIQFKNHKIMKMIFQIINWNYNFSNLKTRN